MSSDSPVESVSVASEKISLNRIAHVFYTHANFSGQRQFLLDFGMSITQETADKIYFRGYGTQPFVYCLARGTSDSFDGVAFVVDSLADLELATQLPSATAIYSLDAPGGGKGVTFYDPIDKFPFHLVYGQELVERTNTFRELSFNFPASKHRATNHTQRFQKGPSLIHKLGHFGPCVTDFASAYTFYTTHFNLKASDLVYDPQTKRDTTCFFHLDRGSEQVDHHSFFIFEGPKFHVHHSSFEVHDFDVQILGHDWLREKGWENCWGVGRHVMGSQIFDYCKFILEHYIDGDMVDERTPTNRSKAEPGNLHIWGKSLSARSRHYVSVN
ncbi:hypothetical protein ACLOAV_005023 [Pseudogymnoascus australis]